ncbi:MAG: hypothetical protein AB1725_04580 [Armatimonadota bacterium]
MRLLGGLVLLLPVLCLHACSGSRAYMPLDEGRSWRYSVVDAYGPRMAMLTVERRARVGDRMGVLLAGDDGTSRLAWEGSTLLGSEFVGCAFDPPIPLLEAGAESASWEWRGAVRRGGTVFSAHVRASQQPSTTDDLGREVPSLRVTLSLSVGGRSETVETHYVRGVGIQRQEVRRDGRQVLLVTLATGR